MASCKYRSVAALKEPRHCTPAVAAAGALVPLLAGYDISRKVRTHAFGVDDTKRFLPALVQKTALSDDHQHRREDAGK
jgi:hypothetical protein